MADNSFRETARAIYDLRTSEQFGFGLHVSDYVTASMDGLDVGDEMLDPSVHEAGDINPVSPLAIATRRYYVSETVPYKPVQMNVIVHDDSANHEQPSWLDVIPDHKSRLARAIFRGISTSDTAGDELKLYLVGNPRQPEAYASGIQFVEGTEDPLAAAKKIAELCRPYALNFVLSDFDDLSPKVLAATSGYDEPTRFRKTVAVKVNHALELEIPRGAGFIPLANGEEVDTTSRMPWAKAKFNRVNRDLSKLHLETVTGLGELGILLAATVAFEANYPTHDDSIVKVPTDGSVSVLDSHVARALESLRRA